MDSQPRGTEWRSILLLIFSLCAMALAILTGITTLVLVAIEGVSAEVPGARVSQLATTLTASGLLFVGALLAPAAWLSLQRLRGREARSLSFSSLRPWAWIVIPGVWAIAMILAALFYDARGAGLFVPPLHFLSIGLPIYLVVRIAVSRIPLGSRQRAWGVFGTGMSLSPFLAIIAEFTIIFFVLVALGIYLGLNPAKISDFQRLGDQLQNAPDLESMLPLLKPYIMNPFALLGALAFLSFFVPIIEETCKSLGIWLVAGRLASPAQGFAMGILSGAGFALAESLFASTAVDDAWALTLSMRAVSGSMHMLASGLVGWGIAYARLEKRWLRWLGMLLLAMTLHGAWNAGAVLTVAGGLRVMFAMPGVDLTGTLFMLIGFGLLLALMLAMFVALFVLNAKLRPPVQAETVPPEMVG